MQMRAGDVQVNYHLIHCASSERYLHLVALMGMRICDDPIGNTIRSCFNHVPYHYFKHFRRLPLEL